MIKPARQRDLSALIDGYQQAYWLASSLDARNGIGLKLWTLRREAQTHQHLLHDSAAPEKARPRPAPRASRATRLLSFIARRPFHYESSVTHR